MKKKSILLIILCVAILSPFIFAIGDGKDMASPEKAIQSSTVKGKQINETDNVMTVKEFIKQIESGKIKMVEVYYYSWTALPYFPISEVALRNKAFDAKSTMKFTSGRHFSTIKKALEGLPLYKMQIESPDYRLGFVAHDRSGRVITLSFIYNVPVVSINGKQYKTSPELVSSVIDFLPHKSYQDINKELVYFWYCHGLSLGTQNNEQGEKDR